MMSTLVIMDCLALTTDITGDYPYLLLLTLQSSLADSTCMQFQITLVTYITAITLPIATARTTRNGTNLMIRYGINGISAWVKEGMKNIFCCRMLPSWHLLLIPQQPTFYFTHPSSQLSPETILWHRMQSLLSTCGNILQLSIVNRKKKLLLWRLELYD